MESFPEHCWGSRLVRTARERLMRPTLLYQILTFSEVTFTTETIDAAVIDDVFLASVADKDIVISIVDTVVFVIMSFVCKFDGINSVLTYSCSDSCCYFLKRCD